MEVERRLLERGMSQEATVFGGWRIHSWEAAVSGLLVSVAEPRQGKGWRRTAQDHCAARSRSTRCRYASTSPSLGWHVSETREKAPFVIGPVGPKDG